MQGGAASNPPLKDTDKVLSASPPPGHRSCAAHQAGIVLTRAMLLRPIAATLFAAAVIALGASGPARAQVDSAPSAPRPAAATTTRLSLAELVARSEVIVTGRVTEFRSQWDAARTRVSPGAVLAANEYLKATVSLPSLPIVYAESGPGMVRFQKDEEILLFLRRNAAGNLEVVGGTQGKFVITKDVRTARKMVSAYQTLDDMRTQVTALLRSGAPKQ